MNTWLPWVVFFFLLGALTLASTLNLALRLPSRVRIAEQFERAGRAGALQAFVPLRPRYMLTTAIVRSAVVLGLFVEVLSYLEQAWPDARIPRLTTSLGVAWSLVLVFGVAIPHAWAKYSGDWIVVQSLPLLSVGSWLCWPLIACLNLFDPLIRRLAGVPVQDAKSFADELEQEILNAVSEGELHGAVDEEEKEMIESVIELGETRVDEIMTPRTEIVAIRKGATLDDVLDTIRTKGHSRIPVYTESVDHVVGILYAKDLLKREEGAPFELAALMRKPVFIPESKLVRELLHEFQERKVHIAVVLDEYGGTAGLVTIEDIIEELVGEIADEYETDDTTELRRIDEHTVEVDARMRVDDLNDELDVKLPEDGDYETLGGFVFSTLGKIPRAGEEFTHRNVGIRVIAAEPRRITRLRLTITPVEENHKVNS